MTVDNFYPIALASFCAGWLMAMIVFAPFRMTPTERTTAMNQNWDKRWLIGWGVVLGIVLAYELVGYGAELFAGIHALPPLSDILVGTIPLRLLDALTIGIAVALVLHWHQVAKDNAVRNTSPMLGIERYYGDPFQEANALGKLWILLKAIPVLIRWILAEWWYAAWKKG
jgi:hypothetical protein